MRQEQYQEGHIRTHLPAPHAIFNPSKVYEQCPFRNRTRLSVADGVIIMRVEMLRWCIFIQPNVRVQ